MCLHFLHDTRFIFIYMYTPHTRGYVHKKTKHREEFEPVIDKPAELLLCFYSRVTWWRETLWLEGRKTFTITWHHRIYPFEAQWFVSFRYFFPFFFSSSFLRQTFIIRHFSIPEKDSFSKLLNFVVGGKIQRCWVTLLFPSLPHPFHHDPCCSSFPFI